MRGALQEPALLAHEPCKEAALLAHESRAYCIHTQAHLNAIVQYLKIKSKDETSANLRAFAEKQFQLADEAFARECQLALVKGGLAHPCRK